MVRRLRPVMLVALLCALILTVTGCGDQVSVAPLSTAAIAGGSAAGTGAPAASKEYETALKDWFETQLTPAQDEFGEMAFHNPLQPTTTEIERARQFAERLRATLAALQEISPPPEIAEAHSQFCASFHAEITAFDRLITGIEGTNENDVDIALRMWNEGLVLEDRALNALRQHVDLSDVIQN